MLAAMLDMSRNGILKMEELKLFAQRLKKMGYDTVALYLEDVYELENEPYFGHLRGRYSKAELKEINTYIKSIGMCVLPCVQTLAHLNGIFRWKEYEDIRDMDDILLIDEPKTYELIDKMFATLAECFDCNIIHIGMDEAWNVGLGKYLVKNGFQNRISILHAHLLKVLSIAEKYSFDCMMWSDMIFTLKEDKQDISDYIPSNVSLCYWNYYSEQESIYDNHLREHKTLTEQIVFAGGAWMWSGFVPQNRYSMDTMRLALSACRKHHIKDVIITMWADDGKECSFNAVLPSLFFCAEKYLYNTPDENIKEKFFTCFGCSFDDFMCLDLPNQIRDCYNGTPSQYGLYQDLFLGQFDYHIEIGDGEECVQYAEKLDSLATTMGEYGYLFVNMANLSKVLALKYDLGVRTRTAYLQKNKKELRRLVDEVYPRLVECVNEFYRSFRFVWEKECKSFGFEIHDMRLGGLQRRIKHCAEILQDYLCGARECIEELELPLLPYVKDKGKTANIYEHCHTKTVSMNREFWL